MAAYARCAVSDECFIRGVDAAARRPYLSSLKNYLFSLHRTVTFSSIRAPLLSSLELPFEL
jgi:hypothetical protein